MTLKGIMNRITYALHKLNEDEAGTSMIEWAIYAAIVATAGITILSRFFGDSGLGKVVNNVIDKIMGLFNESGDNAASPSD